MITHLLRLLGVTFDGPDVVIVPTDQWRRVFERMRLAEARVETLERQLAAMEQSHDC
jgi:hypothetical protein